MILIHGYTFENKEVFNVLQDIKKAAGKKACELYHKLLTEELELLVHHIALNE